MQTSSSFMELVSNSNFSCVLTAMHTRRDVQVEQV